MHEQGGAGVVGLPDAGEPEFFRNVRRLKNHWSRPIGPRAYYWYLTFPDAPEPHSLVRKCQEAINFPYYDLTPPQGLHLTLDRIGAEDDITHGQLAAIEAAAKRACQTISPFDITLGPLSGTRGAVGLTVSPEKRIRELGDTLTAATLSACPGAPVRIQDIAPHVTIAYANTDGVPAAGVVAAVEKLNASACSQATVREAVLVLLERRQRSYAWQVMSRIPLTGEA